MTPTEEPQGRALWGLPTEFDVFEVGARRTNNSAETLLKPTRGYLVAQVADTALSATGTRSHLYNAGHFHTFRKPDPEARKALRAARGTL